MTHDRLPRSIVELACHAPSVHNTQPWSWRVEDDLIELYADRERRLRVADPRGRELVLSCGAALHHAQVAARALGRTPEVNRLPGDAPDLLARIRLRHGPVDPDAARQLEALLTRRTDRRAFGSWPVPETSVRRLAGLAEEWGTRAVVADTAVRRHGVRSLTQRALQLVAADAPAVAEQLHWIDRAHDEGVPSRLVPGGPPHVGSHPNRFGPGMLDDPVTEAEATEAWVVLCSGHDDEAAWLRAGEGLSALWLAAEAIGLAVVPVSHVVEVPETWGELQELLGGLAVPHLVLRIGWQSPVRGDLPPSPRRALADVVQEPGDRR